MTPLMNAAGQLVDDHELAGADVLEDLREALTRYVVLPSPEAVDAVVLWTAATHAQPVWDHAPRLAVVSPIRGCGKSRLMDVVEATCHSPLIAVNASIAAIVRSMNEAEPITLLLDEADAIFGTKRAAEINEDLRGVLNAGHARNRPYVRWDITARTTERIPTFGMAMLCSIGDLPDTIMDRSIVVRMRRRAGEETIRPWRSRRALPPLTEIRERIHAWARDQLGELEGSEPDMPVMDRAADTWEPLVAIADAAGDDWPDRARRACLVMAGRTDPDDGSAGERLLADLHGIFAGAERLATVTILEALQAIDDAPWGEWHGRPLSAHGLARLLKPFGVRSKNVRLASAQAKGYERADLVDAWTRYLRAPEVRSVPASQRPEAADDYGDGSGTTQPFEPRPPRDQDVSTARDAGTDDTAPAPTSGADEVDAVKRLIQEELGGAVVAEIDHNGRRRYRPDRTELLDAASELNYPRVDLTDGTTILAGEEFWKVYCAVALAPQRNDALVALCALNGAEL